MMLASTSVAKNHTMEVLFEPVSEKETIVSLKNSFTAATKKMDKSTVNLRFGQEKEEKKVRATIETFIKK